jgi:hypothetical protein
MQQPTAAESCVLAVHRRKSRLLTHSLRKRRAHQRGGDRRKKDRFSPPFMLDSANLEVPEAMFHFLRKSEYLPSDKMKSGSRISVNI